MLGVVMIAVNEGFALEGLFPFNHHAVSCREVNALEVVSFPLGRFHIDSGIVVHVDGAVDRGAEDESLRILDHLMLGRPHRVGVGNEDDLRLVKPLFGKSFFQTVEHLNVEIGRMMRRAERAFAMSVDGIAEPNVQEIDIGLLLRVVNQPFHLDVHHSLVAHAELREEGGACVKASLALNERHCLVHFLRRFIGLARNVVINAPGRGDIAVAERVELQSRFFEILFQKLDQPLASVVADVLVGKEAVAGMAIPAAHIVVGNDVLHHKEVHVNLGCKNDGRADMLVIGRSLQAFAAEANVRLFMVNEVVIHNVAGNDMLSLRAGANPKASHGLKVIVNAEEDGSLVRSGNVARSLLDLNVDHVVEHIVLHLCGGKSEVGKKAEKDLALARLFGKCIHLLDLGKAERFRNHIKIFLQLLRGIIHGHVTRCIQNVDHKKDLVFFF